MFVFYNQLTELLKAYFSGLVIVRTDEINTNYLRLCVKIQEILEKQGFENLNKHSWRPFINLKNADDIDWEYEGSKECSNFLSIIEEFYISAGEEKYPLSTDDLQLLSSVQNHLRKYQSNKKDLNEETEKMIKEETEKMIKLEAAKELSNKLDNLSETEKKTLRNLLDDVVSDTPKTTNAASKLKNLLTKAGKTATSALRDILVDIMSETAKKTMGF